MMALSSSPSCCRCRRAAAACQWRSKQPTPPSMGRVGCSERPAVSNAAARCCHAVRHASAHHMNAAIAAVAHALRIQQSVTMPDATAARAACDSAALPLPTAPLTAAVHRPLRSAVSMHAQSHRTPISTAGQHVALVVKCPCSRLSSCSRRRARARCCSKATPAR